MSTASPWRRRASCDSGSAACTFCCSATDAADVYGVVLDLEAETVDLAATERRRAQLEAR